MMSGPLRRLVAVAGLLVLAPVAAMLIQGALTPEEAALKALVVGLVVMLLGNLTWRVVAGMLQRVERRAGDGASTADARR